MYARIVGMSAKISWYPSHLNQSKYSWLWWWWCSFLYIRWSLGFLSSSIEGFFFHGMKVLEFLNVFYSWNWNLKLLGYCFIFFLLIEGIHNLQSLKWVSFYSFYPNWRRNSFLMRNEKWLQMLTSINSSPDAHDIALPY